MRRRTVPLERARHSSAGVTAASTGGRLYLHRGVGAIQEIFPLPEEGIDGVPQVRFHLLGCAADEGPGIQEPGPVLEELRELRLPGQAVQEPGEEELGHQDLGDLDVEEDPGRGVEAVIGAQVAVADQEGDPGLEVLPAAIRAAPAPAPAPEAAPAEDPGKRGDASSTGEAGPDKKDV